MKAIQEKNKKPAFGDGMNDDRSQVLLPPACVVVAKVVTRLKGIKLPAITRLLW